MRRKLISGLMILALSGCRANNQSNIEIITNETVRKYKQEQAENFYDVGFALFRKGAYELALEYFKKALEKKPNYSPANDKAAEIYLSQGKYGLAEYHARTAVENSPDNPFYKATLRLIQDEREKQRKMQQIMFSKLYLAN